MNNAVHGNLAFSKNQFPYHFGLLKSELGSPIDSEEDDFFAELKRRVAFSEARKVTPLDLRRPSEILGGSPQSILGGIGSWSGRSSYESYQSPLQGPSPPATPYDSEYDSAGLIYAAAGQIERLKMSTEVSFKGLVSNTKSEVNHLATPDFLAEQNYLDASRRAYNHYSSGSATAYNAALLYEHHLQNISNSMPYTRSVAGQSPWSVQRQQPRVPTKANFQSATLPRKESVGTGVFLPRRYNTAPAVPPRKRVANTSAIVPAKVVPALHMSFEEMNSSPLPHYSAYAASMSQKNYEALMARRSAFLAEQQRADAIVQSNLEVCLPQEWIY